MERRRLGLFPASKCRLPAPRHMTLPEPVLLNRFATDFRVLIPLGRRILFRWGLLRFRLLLPGLEKTSESVPGVRCGLIGDSRPRLFLGVRYQAVHSSLLGGAQLLPGNLS